MSNQKDDVETALLYPSMEEMPELRWGFIRKVYSILTLQLLATIGFAFIVTSVPPVANFFNNTLIGVTVYIVLLIVTIILICLIYIFQHKHPLNFILLGILTLYFGMGIGVVASFVDGKIVIEAGISTVAVVISLTLYTFWAAKRGHHFSFLHPFLLSLLVITTTFGIFLIFFPTGKISEMLYSGLVVILLCFYIICDTLTLIMRYSYDQYIWASLSLYLDIINLFLEILKIIKAIER